MKKSSLVYQKPLLENSEQYAFLKCNFNFFIASYRRLTGDGEKCPTDEKIQSEEICKKAASELGLKFTLAWSSKSDFPACFAVNDAKGNVFFNRDPNANGDSKKYNGICLG